jgi:Cd2+/Zn2+-exporting ATPase/Cu+-exporting ATPase
MTSPSPRTAIGEFFTALVITLFVLVAEVLEGLTVGRGRRAIGTCSNSCRGRSPCAARALSARSRAGTVRRRCHLVAPGGHIGRWCRARALPSMNPASRGSMPVRCWHAGLRRLHQPVRALEIAAERIGVIRATADHRAVGRAEVRAPVLPRRPPGRLSRLFRAGCVLTF